MCICAVCSVQSAANLECKVLGEEVKKVVLLNRVEWDV